MNPTNGNIMRFMTRGLFAASLALFSFTSHAADLIIDNGSAQFSTLGDWPLSTAVAGYLGSNYQTHAAHGPVPGALTTDNSDPGFSVTGDWPRSTAVAGYLGANYQTHIANGPRPGSLVSDNASGTPLGTWPTSTAVAGYLGSNYQTHAAGTGENRFTWPLAGNGQYRVYARWTAHANRASNAAYQVQHAGGVTTLNVNQQQNGGQWQLLGTFDLAADSRVTLTDAANGYVIADAVMAEPVDAAPNTASWTLPLTVSKSYRVYTRWSAHPNRASNARYTVSHQGGDTEVTVNQQQGGGQWQLLGTFVLTPGQRHLRLTDQANGYVIADAVMAVPEDAPMANSAIWTPVLTEAGTYDVFARWSAHPNRASNAPYTIRHQTGETTVLANQQQNGGQWQLLGRFDLAPGQATITLTDDANGYVIADAIQLTQISASGPKLYYLHTDHLDTPRAVTDETNKVVWRNLPLNEPFGNNPPEEDPDGDGQDFTMNLRFPGQYADKETNTNYNYFRDYDPNTGRYVQSDPIGLAGGINTYLYSAANPMVYVDPFGLDNPSMGPYGGVSPPAGPLGRSPTPYWPGMPPSIPEAPSVSTVVSVVGATAAVCSVAAASAGAPVTAAVLAGLSGISDVYGAYDAYTNGDPGEAALQIAPTLVGAINSRVGAAGSVVNALRQVSQ